MEMKNPHAVAGAGAPDVNLAADKGVSSTVEYDISSPWVPLGAKHELLGLWSEVETWGPAFRLAMAAGAMDRANLANAIKSMVTGGDFEGFGDTLRNVTGFFEMTAGLLRSIEIRFIISAHDAFGISWEETEDGSLIEKKTSGSENS